MGKIRFFSESWIILVKSMRGGGTTFGVTYITWANNIIISGDRIVSTGWTDASLNGNPKVGFNDLFLVSNNFQGRRNFYQTFGETDAINRGMKLTSIGKKVFVKGERQTNYWLDCTFRPCNWGPRGTTYFEYEIE